MAKSLRSSRNKTNKARLRAHVFGPVEDSRTARLSEKLYELAQQPRRQRTEMDVDSDRVTEKEEAGNTQEMDVEETAPSTEVKPRNSKSTPRRKSGRVQKRQRKARNQIAFPKKLKHGGGPGIVRKNKN